MKKGILLFLMIGLVTKAYSQDKKIEFHLSVGPTLSIPKTSKLNNPYFQINPEIKSSINIGAYISQSLNYQINQNSSIDFGIGYYLDRFTIEHDKLGPEINKGNRNVSQIRTPINYNFHFGRNNSFQLGVGGFLSYLIFAKEKGETIMTTFVELDRGIGFESNVGYNNDIKNNYELLSFGAFIQLKRSISYSSSKKGFILLRLNQFINSIKPPNSDYITEEREPTTLSFGIGIVF